jgi:hypothetical protein
MVTIEKIDEFRKRTNSSYEDARYFLEKNQGDVLEAIIEFERSKGGRHPKMNQPQQPGDVGKKLAAIIQQSFDIRLSIDDKNGTLLAIPVILLILMLPFLWLPLFGCIFLIALGYKLSFKTVKTQGININQVFENLRIKLREMGNKSHRSPFDGQNPTNNKEGYTQYNAQNMTNQPSEAPSNIVWKPTQTPVEYSQPSQNVRTEPAMNVQTEPMAEPVKDDGYKEFTVE